MNNSYEIKIKIRVVYLIKKIIITKNIEVFFGFISLYLKSFPHSIYIGYNYIHCMKFHCSDFRILNYFLYFIISLIISLIYTKCMKEIFISIHLGRYFRVIMQLTKYYFRIYSEYHY